MQYLNIPTTSAELLAVAGIVALVVRVCCACGCGGFGASAGSGSSGTGVAAGVGADDAICAPRYSVWPLLILYVLNGALSTSFLPAANNSWRSIGNSVRCAAIMPLS